MLISLRIYTSFSLATNSGIYTNFTNPKNSTQKWVCRKTQRMPLNPSAVLFERDANTCLGVYIVRDTGGLALNSDFFFFIKRYEK
jgi:hypothetical protein